MSQIDLTGLPCQVGTPRYRGWGAKLKPILGGPSLNLHRLGTRFALDVTVPPIDVEPHGRRWAARLQLAHQFGAIIAFPQVEFDPGACGDPVAEAVSGGMMLPIIGGTPRYAVREGQFFNLTHMGEIYLYCAAAGIELDANGDGEVPLTTMLRTQVSSDDAINLKEPVIAGSIEGADFEWPFDLERNTTLQFTIEEDA